MESFSSSKKENMCIVGHYNLFVAHSMTVWIKTFSILCLSDSKCRIRWCGSFAAVRKAHGCVLVVFRLIFISLILLLDFIYYYCYGRTPIFEPKCVSCVKFFSSLATQLRLHLHGASNMGNRRSGEQEQVV